MIFGFIDNTRYYSFYEPVDMSRGIHSHDHLVKTSGNKNALNGNGYVLNGETRKSIKVFFSARTFK